MSIDWDAIDDVIKASGRGTDDKLASRISSITRLTEEEVTALFPKPADAARLVELMRIVKGATAETEKRNKLAANIEQLGGVVVKLLEKLL